MQHSLRFLFSCSDPLCLITLTPTHVPLWRAPHTCCVCLACLPSTDITPEEFQRDYAQATIKTISEISGVPPESITASIVPEAPAARSAPAAAPAAQPAARPAPATPAAAAQQTQPAPAAAPAAGGNRKLLQEAPAAPSGGLKVKYNIKTANTTATTARIKDALQNNGETFYQVCVQLPAIPKFQVALMLHLLSVFP